MGEEEIGAFGHEQTVIEATTKDSTSAKSTSAIHVPRKDMTTADHQVTNIEQNWSDEDIKVLEGMKKAAKEVTINSNGGEAGEEGEEGEEGAEGATTATSTTKKKDANADQLQEGEGEEEIEQAPELTEDELEAQRIDAENAAIEENFEAYANLDAAEETKKIQEKEMAKNKRKAVSFL